MACSTHTDALRTGSTYFELKFLSSLSHYICAHECARELAWESEAWWWIVDTITALFLRLLCGGEKNSGAHRVHNGNWKVADTKPCSSSYHCLLHCYDEDGTSL